MLRGLYEFRPINEKTLGFHAHDLLLFLEPHARDKNWLRVADAHGHIGFVPINFIEIHRETTSLLGFLEEAIRRAKRERLHTADLLSSVRQNILASRFSMDEQLAQIERQVSELRSRAISELSYDDVDYHHHAPPPRRAPLYSNKAKETNNKGRGGYAEGGSRSGGGHGGGRHHHHSAPYSGHHTQLGGEEGGGGLAEGAPETSPYVLVTAQPAKGAKSCSKKSKKGGTEGATQYAEITVGGGGVKEEGVPEGCPPPPPSMILLMDAPQESRRCSTGHCQRSQEHVCCCSPSAPKPCALRPAPSSLDTPTMAAELVDIVRNATGLSHKLSQDASEVVLQYVSENIVGMPEEVSKLLLHMETTPKAVSGNAGVIARSPDAYNIRKIFHRLTEAKDDEQQRSWALYEDESMILENLDHLYAILRDADASISKYVMESECYVSVGALVLYYQMETRWSIRAKLIDVFGAMVNIDGQALSILLNSILPMELAREIRESAGHGERLIVCAGLLVMLLCVGEAMPMTAFDHLGKDFLQFVLALVENPPEEKIADVFMNLLFAYNLQFKAADDNLIVDTLEERLNANVFTQKVIYFLNRELDPIDILDHPRDAPNSVFKLTTDVFSSKKAADLFYTNDIKVLIDIVTRCVTDLGPGEKRRTSYLKLIQVIVRNSNFGDHRHRVEDLQNCFMSILLEEEPLAILDQKLIRDIVAEFPAFFKTC